MLACTSEIVGLPSAELGDLGVEGGKVWWLGALRAWRGHPRGDVEWRTGFVGPVQERDLSWVSQFGSWCTREI